jgi:D-alanyl-D-alanine carboxypeptidase
MVSRSSVSRLASVISSVGLVLAGSAIAIDSADARPRRHRAARHQGYTPPYAAYVVDANTGKVLHAQNENELRHPASVTKVMTLYLLFEQLEKGRVKLDSEIRISQHAASMAPSKLGLRPGSAIEVEDAILAVVTKSANDIAAAIGEHIGGSEERFAEMMTAKARALGMTRTHYENASGLPNPDQVTTARDLSILGRAIQERFPKYYAYFSRHDFTFGGRTMRNHNHLLGRVEGVDGIKTGYTRASGFNLLTSAKMGNRRIVSVVLGGRTAGVRDQIMAGLVEKHLENASPVRVAAPIVESGPALAEIARPEPRETVREVAPARAEPMKPVAIAAVQQKPEQPRALAFSSPTAASAALAPPALLTQPLGQDRPRPAVIASVVKPDDKVGSIPDRKPVSLDGSTRPVAAAASSTTPPLRWVTGPAAQQKPSNALRPPENVKTANRVEPQETRIAKVEPPPAATGAIIQIGAPNDLDKANELLARAKSKNPALAHARSFTEKIQKGSETLFRARFAGLSEDQADAACKSLKRTGFACFTTKN